MARYIICPRCELNFIDADEQEYCEVCIKEMSGEKTFTDDFESEEGWYRWTYTVEEIDYDRMLETLQNRYKINNQLVLNNLKS